MKLLFLALGVVLGAGLVIVAAVIVDEWELEAETSPDGGMDRHGGWFQQRRSRQEPA